MALRRTTTSASQREPVLGTVLSVQVTARGGRALARAERAALVEIGRLEAIFSIFDADSELRRWAAADGDVAVSEDLRALLALSLDHQQRSAGAFNPAAGLVDRLWRQAEVDGEPPSPAALAEVTGTIAQPRYRVVGDRIDKLGDCRDLTFNALAKGLIVDRAAHCAWLAADLESLVVNIGGDLVHRGAGAAKVNIENPNRPFDNEPPLTRVALSNAGMATSGRARRGYRVAGVWYGHVLDPRSGWPTDGVGSATVLTSSTGAADALATVVAVLGAADGLAFLADHHDGAAALVVDHDGTVHRNPAWETLAA